MIFAKLPSEFPPFRRFDIVSPTLTTAFEPRKFNSKHSEFLSIKAMGLNISKDEQYQVIIEYPDKTVSTINLQY